MNLTEETCRYMGVKGRPDSAMTDLANEAVESVKAAANFRNVCRRFSLLIPDDRTVKIGSREVTSRALARHLAGCQGVLLLAVTLGSGVDRLLARSGAQRPSLMVAQQAAAAALAEEYSDRCCKEAQERLAGYRLLPRFSPGYGDWSLQDQSVLLEMLDASRKIGLTVTQSGMLTPLKSITAAVGIKPEMSQRKSHESAEK